MLKVSRKIVNRLPRKIMRAKANIQIRKNHALILDTKDPRIIKAEKNIISLYPNFPTILATLLEPNVLQSIKMYSNKIIRPQTIATHKTIVQSNSVLKVNSGNKFNVLTISRIINSKFLKNKDKEKVTFLSKLCKMSDKNKAKLILKRIFLSIDSLNLLHQILPMDPTL